ncbi:hypothetical protein FF38_04431 [Lucilia cuprina]|uniref:F-box domain-containing protein n=1 Tax=Lucilia cuprina TaxID=7375 RepID=A0A0L0BL64_LUCCU|nr:hypothetical protein CVS40_9948 [Lucilia cuprina]KNC20693.1 hypothetical protein FF38_04431 [Lucilia cuprina]
MEKVITNVDVLYEIFQYLNLEELLKLTQVCRQFRIVIVDFIWKNKYKNLEVCKMSQHFGMLLTNNAANNNYNRNNEVGYECVKEDKTILNRKDIDTFLQLIVDNIKTLVLYTPTINYKSLNDDNDMMKCSSLIFSPTEFGVTFDYRHRFINLTAISFQHVIICEKDLRLLNRYCSKLQKICLDNCFNSNEKTLVMGEDIKINTLQNMSELKILEITVSDTIDKELTYDLNKILNKLNMLQLVIQIRNFTINEEDDNGVATRQVLGGLTNPCEELTIGYFRSQRIFRKFNNLILNNFKCLKKLVLESWSLISINEDFFKKLQKTCSQLEYLKLQNFEIASFATISTLNTFILENCSGLIWRDLMAILSNMKLKTFSITDTEYIGIFEYFKVATTLENMLVNNCQRNHLKKLFELNNGVNLRNLSTLIWHDNFAQMPIYVATSCLKLRTLITEPSSLLINNLYSLSSLEKLKLRVGRKIKFSKIMIILKHPNLRHFTLTKLEGSDGYDEYDDYLIDYDIYDQELMEFEDKRINLTFLNISLNSFFKIVQDFWFNLLQNNPKLIIMIRYNRLLHNDHTFLKFIINHRKFPKRLKSIKICGYRIEIREFKENFETAIEKIKTFSNLYKDKEDKGYILL